MKAATLVVTLMLTACFAVALPIEPLEDQLQVNTHITGVQKTPVVAVSDSGSYVVIWTTENSPGPDTSGASIRGRMYDANGVPASDEFQVNTHASGHQTSPSVAMRPTGEFVVVWGSTAGPGDGFYCVLGQRFDADGRTVGDEFRVNTLTADVQESPAVAMTDTGEFLIVWQSAGSFGTDDDLRSIQARLYANDGTPDGPEFQVNDYIASDQAGAEVAAGPDGEYVVTWFNVSGSAGTDQDGRSVQAQMISSIGAFVGAEFQVNTFTTSHQHDASAAIGPLGEFTIVWTSDGSSGTDSDYSIQGQKYDSDGLPVGDEFQVNTYIDDYQIRPSIAMTDDGAALVSWTSGDYSGAGPDGDGWGIAAQVITPDGSFDGDEIVVNNVADGPQDSSSVAGASGHRWVATWQSESSPGDDDDGSVQARRFAGVDDGLIFTDGFESGDVSAWGTP